VRVRVVDDHEGRRAFGLDEGQRLGRGRLVGGAGVDGRVHGAIARLAELVDAAPAQEQVGLLEEQVLRREVPGAVAARLGPVPHQRRTGEGVDGGGRREARPQRRRRELGA
jgi:hypothetical protein